MIGDSFVVKIGMGVNTQNFIKSPMKLVLLMARIEIDIPDDLEFRIQRLVDDGEFATYEEAVQELVSTGLTAHRASGTTEDDDEFNEFDDEFGTQEPPGHEDEYAF